jgi:hypothetical protein
MVFELRKRPAAVPGESADLTAACPLLSTRPALRAMLCDVSYADGSRRVTATLLVFTDGGAFKACLRDRDTEETAWVTGQGLTGLLDALEVGLQEGRLDWRKESKRNRR